MPPSVFGALHTSAVVRAHATQLPTVPLHFSQRSLPAQLLSLKQPATHLRIVSVSSQY